MLLNLIQTTLKPIIRLVLNLYLSLQTQQSFAWLLGTCCILFIYQNHTFYYSQCFKPNICILLILIYMDLLKVLITLAVLLSLYIIYTWWARTGGLSRFNTQYHVLGCYASDTIVDYPSQIKADLEKLNLYEERLDSIDLKDLQWLDKLLPELSNKLEIFEKNYYESKADNVKSLLVEKKLQDAINQHEQCLSRVPYYDPKDCENVRQSQGQIKLQIDRNFADINRLNDQKKRLQEDFQRQKVRRPSPQPVKPIILPKDDDITRLRTTLLNTRDRIRDLEKQRIVILERIQTNRNNLDKCQASHQLAKICETITTTLEQFVDEQYHLTSIQERIEIKTKQFKVLKEAIESCTGNCEDANREADKCRIQLVNLIKIQAQLREKEAKCKQLCTKEQIAALEEQKLSLQGNKLQNSRLIQEANSRTIDLQRQIKDLQLQVIAISPAMDAPLDNNQKLKQTSDDITEVYRQIKNKHSNIQVLLDSLNAKDNKYSQHVRNIEILNSCAVLREVAQKLSRQVYDQSRTPGVNNRISLSRTELIRILDNIKKA